MGAEVCLRGLPSVRIETLLKSHRLKGRVWVPSGPCDVAADRDHERDEEEYGAALFHEGDGGVISKGWMVKSNLRV